MVYIQYIIPFLTLLAPSFAQTYDHGGDDVTYYRMPAAQKPPKFPLQPIPHPMPPPGFAVEDNSDNEVEYRECGPNIGSCAEGACCSPQGYCGLGPSYCSAPDCLFEHGSGCDLHKTPVGGDTLNFTRDHVGAVPYGYAPIYQCVVPNTIALTYDDGPDKYTSDLLDILDSYDAKATFFVSGINSNKGQIDDPEFPWLKMINRMYNSGHQIASHTWSHQDLDVISSSYRRDQMIKNEMALRNILGGFPTYMRPPYSSCSARSGCLGDMDELGYHVSYFDLDTDDYNNDSPDMIQRSKDIFDDIVSMNEGTGSPLLVIAHDVHEQTVYNLTTFMLRRLLDADYRPVTMGECLGDPPSNWYRWDVPDEKDEKDEKDENDQYGKVPDKSEGSNPPEEKVPEKTPEKTPEEKTPEEKTPEDKAPEEKAPEEKVPDRKRPGRKRPGKPRVSRKGRCGPRFTCLGSKFGDCCSAEGRCGNSLEHCGIGCQTNAGACFATLDPVLDDQDGNEEE